MLTFGIFAYNEELNILNTIGTLYKALTSFPQMKYEVIIVDDGSEDRTYKILQELKAKYENMIVIKHGKNRGIGASISTIVDKAKYPKICFIPGDDVFSLYTDKKLIENAFRADVILHYHMNDESRTRFRSILSLLFKLSYVIFFDIRVQYINCISIFSLDFLKGIKIVSGGYNIAAELNVKALLKGASYLEIPSYMKKNRTKSRAVKLKNFIDVSLSFLKLLIDVKVINRKHYRKTPFAVMDEIEFE